MKKICVALLLTTLMLAMIPIAAGIQPQVNQRQNPNPDGFFGRTFIRGIIIGYHDYGIREEVTAIFCRYTIIKLFHPPVSGFYIFRHLTFLRKFFGYHGMFLIDGFFRGTTFT
jgi:hypothetical protein